MSRPPEYFQHHAPNDPHRYAQRPAPTQPQQYYPQERYAIDAPREAAWSWWLKRAGAGLALGGLIAGVVDLLQPLAPFAWLAIGASIFGLALVGALIAIMRGVNPKVHERLVELACFLTIVLVGATGIKIAQAVTPEGNTTGFIASRSPEVRQMQASLLSIEQRLVSFGQGLGRIEQGVGRVEQTTASIDTRTAMIATGVEDTKRGLEQDRDPVTQAEREKQAALLKLQQLGFAADNAGYFRAVMQSNYDARGQYSVLGIAGDEKSLRAAMLAHPANSPEFKALLTVFQQLHTGHYAMPVVNELRAMLKGLRQVASGDPLYKATCGGAATSFVDKVLKNTLAQYCGNDGEWFRETVGVIKDLKMSVDPPDPSRMDEATWWYGLAEYLQFRPANSRAVTLAELEELLRAGSSAEPQSVHADTEVSFGNTYVTVRVGYDITTIGAAPVRSYLYKVGAKTATACPPQAPCKARVYFVTGAAQGMKVAAVENVVAQ